MFTKNFDNFMLTVACGQITASGQGSTLTESDWRNPNNTVCRDSYGTYYNYGVFRPNWEGSMYYTANGMLYTGNIKLGEQLTTEQDSDIPVESYYDWKLQHQLGWSEVGTMTRSVTEESGVKYLNIKKTFNNTSGTTKYVREIGIFSYGYCGSSSSTTYNILLYRKLLPSPVEVEANANYEVNLKISLTDFRPNLPTV